MVNDRTVYIDNTVLIINDANYDDDNQVIVVEKVCTSPPGGQSKLANVVLLSHCRIRPVYCPI